MSFGQQVRGIELPNPKKVLEGYKDIKTSMQRVDVNVINVRFYYPNSPMYKNTKGMLYHFTTCTLLKIDVPEKLGWLIQDNSIYFDKDTKEEWVEARPDYPLTLNVNRDLGTLLKNAVQQFPDVLTWYLPSSINQIPVKNVIIYNDPIKRQEQKDDLEKSGVARNLIEWMDEIPAEVTITPKFLYDFMDIQVVNSLKDEEGKFNWVIFIMGGLFFSLISILFMMYIGR